LYSTYRKERISAFILIIGVVDGIIGGFNEHWTLLSLGVLLVITSATVRWLQIQKSQNSQTKELPKRYLSPSTSYNPLPTITIKKNMRTNRNN
jgi:hypothetical protein